MGAIRKLHHIASGVQHGVVVVLPDWATVVPLCALDDGSSEVALTPKIERKLCANILIVGAISRLNIINLRQETPVGSCGTGSSSSTSSR